MEFTVTSDPVLGRPMVCERLAAEGGMSTAIFGANDCADLMSSSSCFLLLCLNWDRGGSGDCLGCNELAVQLWHLLQDAGAKSSSGFFASSSIFILFWHNVGIPKKKKKINVSLLLLGAVDSANSAAECWEAEVERELFHSVLLPRCSGALQNY